MARNHTRLAHELQPVPEGPVVTRDNVLVALTELHGPRGDFGLIRLGGKGSGRVFRRPAAGLAQGALAVTPIGLWIWWQDHIVEPKGTPRINAYAGAVNSCTGKVHSVQRFWRGRAGVPISAEIVELAGTPTVLYMKSRADLDAFPGWPPRPCGYLARAAASLLAGWQRRSLGASASLVCRRGVVVVS